MLLLFTPELCGVFLPAAQAGIGGGGAKNVNGAANKRVCELIFQEKRKQKKV